jgi:hypothetical protein
VWKHEDRCCCRLIQLWLPATCWLYLLNPSTLESAKLSQTGPGAAPPHPTPALGSKGRGAARRLNIAADNPGSFIDDTPTAKLVRQVLGAISEFDKAMTVAKLRGARERKRKAEGKCEGRKSHAERNPELVAWVKRLRRQKPKGGRMSLREISARKRRP